MELAGSGTLSSGIMLLVDTGSPGTADANVELWNGSNWTEVNDLNTARVYY